MLRLVDSKPEIDADIDAKGSHIEKTEGLLQLKDIHFRYRTWTPFLCFGSKC